MVKLSQERRTMAKFMFIYRYPVGVFQSTSPEKMQEVMHRSKRADGDGGR